MTSTLLSNVGKATTGIATRGPTIKDRSGTAMSGNPNPIAPFSIAAPHTTAAAAINWGAA